MRKYEIGSGNVFKDLRLPNAEEHLIKAQLVYKIDGILKRRKLKQVEAGRLFGSPSPMSPRCFAVSSGSFRSSGCCGSW
jgi:predicted XRE-type DNA-binding protein